VNAVLRRHVRDVLAIIVLLVIGVATTVSILSRQTTAMPEWVPLLGEDRFELKAELSSGQALTPGQGQKVTIAGVEVGDITDVTVEDGRAVVTMQIEQQYARAIYPNATALLRPRSGLQDMTLAMNPGSGDVAVEEGEVLPVSQTQPNVQSDEILASLDADTQAYVKLLLSGAGQGLKNRGAQLAAGLRRLAPFTRDIARTNAGLAKRRHSLERVIHSFRLLSEELGLHDQQLGEFVDSSNAVLASFAAQEGNLRRSLGELPGALRATHTALESSDRLALQAAPTLRELTPAARDLGPGLRATRSLFRRTVEPIRSEIRPFTRKVHPTVRHLKQAAGPLAETTKGLRGGTEELNRLFNALAFNPSGNAEGYLFFLNWLSHDLNALNFIQDAHGPMGRVLPIFSCSDSRLIEATVEGKPFLRTVKDLTNIPSTDEIATLGGCGG